MARSIGKRLEKFQLQDDAGSMVRLGSLWKEKTTVLLYVRHFG